MGTCVIFQVRIVALFWINCTHLPQKV